MPSPYNPGHRQAMALGLALGVEGSQFASGNAVKVTSQTTLVVAHGLTGTPTFIMVSGRLKAGNLMPTVAANSTNITLTRTTATSSWSISYIVGVVV